MKLFRFFNLKFYFIIYLSCIVFLINGNAISQNNIHKWNFEDTPEWFDEFENGDQLDSAKWTFETGGDGWGNNELQYYTKGENALIENGILKIIAKKESKKKKKYTSSRIVTKNKADWLYGRVEVKAKLPDGRGTWPAFWMLPVKYSYGSETSSGEIDIMEHVGYEPDIVHFSIHNKAYNSGLKNEKTTKLKVKKSSISFHIYRLDWTPYGIRGFVDGKKYFEYKNTGKGSKYWPFDKKFFLIINLAIGGDWGGINGIDNSIFPATMEIDYVRVYNFIE